MSELITVNMRPELFEEFKKWLMSQGWEVFGPAPVGDEGGLEFFIRPLGFAERMRPE